MELHIDIRLEGSDVPSDAENGQIESLLVDLRNSAIAPIVGTEAGRGRVDIFLRISSTQAARKPAIKAVRAALNRSNFSKSSSITILYESRKKISLVRLPLPGEAFVFPVFETKLGCCRVLRGPTEEEELFFGGAAVLVATSSWIGEVVPETTLRTLRDTLVLTHHSHKGRKELFWTRDPLPTPYRPIGIIEPSSEETAQECNVHGGWTCAYQVEAQHEWDKTFGSGPKIVK